MVATTLLSFFDKLSVENKGSRAPMSSKKLDTNIATLYLYLYLLNPYQVFTVKLKGLTGRFYIYLGDGIGQVTKVISQRNNLGHVCIIC